MLKDEAAEKFLDAYGGKEIEDKYWAIDKDIRKLKSLQYAFYNARDDGRNSTTNGRVK